MPEKKKSQLIYLTKNQRKFVEEQSRQLGLTMNGYIVSLLNKEISKK